MPPKNKKDAELEAQRLEQERKRKEQEDARLAEEQRKYGTQVLDDGLVLLFTQFFLLQAEREEDSFVVNILDKYIHSLNWPSNPTPKAVKAFRNEQQHALQFALRHFGISKQLKLGQTSPPQQIEKARIFLGIVLAVYMQDNECLMEQGKEQAKDAELVEQLLRRYSFDKQVFKREDVLAVREYLKRGFLQHYRLRQAYLVSTREEVTEVQELAMVWPSSFEGLAQGMRLDLKPK